MHQLQKGAKTKMIEQALCELQIPPKKLIQMIEELINCLNYPKTKKMIIHQKNIQNHKPLLAINGNKNQDTGEMEIQQQKCDNNCQKNMIEEQKNGKHGEVVNEKTDQKQQNINSENACNNKTAQRQNIWKHDEIKYYSSFASFSQIVNCINTNNSNKNGINIKQHQNPFKYDNNNNNNNNSQICSQFIQAKPALLYIFSALDTVTKLKKYIVPVYRNLSIQPKYSMPTRFMQASPREHYLTIIDQQSNIILIDLQKKIIKFENMEQKQFITCIKWLNHGKSFVVGTMSGKLVIYGIQCEYETKIIETLTPHAKKNNNNCSCQIVSLYCDKDCIYSCCADFSVAKTSIKNWQILRMTNLKGSWLSRMIKIENKKFKDIIFAIEQSKTEVLMLDQVTGFSNVVFSIHKHHVLQCKKLQDKQNGTFSNKEIVKNSWIQNIQVNNQSNTIIVCVSGINPSIYQIDPQRNEVILRLNYQNFKQHSPFLENEQHKSDCKNSNIHMSISHRSQLLILTTNSRIIFYIRLKNWRILHEYIEMQNGIKFGEVCCSKRLADTEQRMEYRQGDNMEKDIIQKYENNMQKQKQSILCIQNIINGNIEIYYIEKESMKIIKSDIQKQFKTLSTSVARFLGHGQGFLEVIQSFRNTGRLV